MANSHTSGYNKLRQCLLEMIFILCDLQLRVLIS